MNNNFSPCSSGRLWRVGRTLPGSPKVCYLDLNHAKFFNLHVLNMTKHFVLTMQLFCFEFPREVLKNILIILKATIPLMRLTLVPKDLKSIRCQCNHARSNLSATVLVARVNCDQSYGSALSTSVTQHSDDYF